MSQPPFRILIVEDSPEDREFYRRRIALGRERDYVFYETSLGEEGLRLCREMTPDCILLDYQLPDLNGLEFLDGLATEDGAPALPIIMLTGHGNEAVAVEAMKRGIHDYLVKGMNHEGLHQVVHAAIDKGVLRRQVAAQRRELDRMSAERLALVDELKQQATALTEANRCKDDFLAMLGHELRNPLAPLRNMLQVMQRRGVQDPDIVEAHAFMDRQVNHLARLVDDLLDVSRIAHGRIELRKETVDVAALLRRTLELNRSYQEAQRHEVAIKLPSAPLFVEADPVRLEQVFSNLLNNATKYTDPGGRIALTVAPVGAEAVIRIQDNGLGISPELMPRLFDLFTQGSRSLDRSQGGLGLGLTLVKSLVELHGGTVEASSAGPGQGSEFLVRLPALAAPPPAAEPPALDGRAPPRSRRVLVVDDNRDAAESLAILLRMEGHSVRTAYDGPAALAAAVEQASEVVLLDIGLPGMDGYQVAKKLRQEPDMKKVILVALTGYGQLEDRCRAQEVGFDAHLVKPADLDVLHALLQASGLPAAGDALRPGPHSLAAEAAEQSV